MNIPRAFAAGVLGAGAMTVIMLFARLWGLTALNLELLLGSIVTRQLDPATWLIGLGIHFMTGGLAGMLYALGFEKWTLYADSWIGLVFGSIHGFAGGFLIALMPVVHPLMPDILIAPGPFGINFGLLTAATFMGLHLLYGAMVGGFYETRSKARVIRIHNVHEARAHSKAA